jgi:hypothetical protein
MAVHAEISELRIVMGARDMNSHFGSKSAFQPGGEVRQRAARFWLRRRCSSGTSQHQPDQGLGRIMSRMDNRPARWRRINLGYANLGWRKRDEPLRRG